MPKTVTPTADFLYLRFLGRHGQYATKDKELRDPTADLRHWQQAIKPHLTASSTYLSAISTMTMLAILPKAVIDLKKLMGLDITTNKILQQGRLF